MTDKEQPLSLTTPSTRAFPGYHLLRALRPKQWDKNAVVFAGLVFSAEQQLTHIDALLRVAAAFVLFCLISGTVYLINDLADIESDRLHPRKRKRPLASGDLSPGVARVAAVILPLVSFGLIAWFALAGPGLDEGWAWFGLVLLAYLVLQVAYTFSLKHMVLVDVFAIAAGFVLRALGGTLVISVHITTWWLLSVFFLALFLGLGKRRAELHDLDNAAGDHRPILKEYSKYYLDSLLLIVIACTIMVYSQATFNAAVARNLTAPYLMGTIPLVVFALFRYLYLVIQQGKGGEPADLLFQDRPFLATIVLWGVMVLAIQLFCR